MRLIALLSLLTSLFATGQPTPAMQQRITWHACVTSPSDALGAALDEAGAQCGSLAVPLDHRRPSGRKITVALARIKAADPARRRGILMLNPGGPGGSGMELLLAAPMMPAVAARYDLIGMDPRFVGRNEHIECRWQTDTFIRSAGPDLRSYRRSVVLMKDLAAGCAQGNLDLLPHATTRNTARDMDLIRQALGEPRLNYLGFSYGTYLGAVYLQMFGAHADRFVLDSAVDPEVYGPGLLSRNAPAMQAALEHWAGWAAAHDGDYHLGGTVRAVLATVSRARLDADLLPYYLFTRLYSDAVDVRAHFAAEVSALTTPGAELPASLQEFLRGVTTGAGTAADRVGTPIVCADRPAARSYYPGIEAHRRDEPLFGPMTRNITPCAFWPVRGSEPPTTIGNDRPALIVGADGDPATPYPGQLAMHRALRGSRMLTLRGGFGHTQFLQAGNACVDAAVTGYLVDGARPAAECSIPASPGR